MLVLPSIFGSKISHSLYASFRCSESCEQKAVIMKNNKASKTVANWNGEYTNRIVCQKCITIIAVVPVM